MRGGLCPCSALGSLSAGVKPRPTVGGEVSALLSVSARLEGETLRDARDHILRPGEECRAPALGGGDDRVFVCLGRSSGESEKKHVWVMTFN